MISTLIVFVKKLLEDVHEQLLHTLDVLSHRLRFLHEIFEDSVPFLVDFAVLPALRFVFFLEMVQFVLVLLGLFLCEEAGDFEVVYLAVYLAQHALQFLLFNDPVMLLLLQDFHLIS
jgi:hypothetical protein